MTLALRLLGAIVVGAAAGLAVDYVERRLTWAALAADFREELEQIGAEVVDEWANGPRDES